MVPQIAQIPYLKKRTLPSKILSRIRNKIRILVQTLYGEIGNSWQDVESFKIKKTALQKIAENEEVGDLIIDSFNF